MKTLDRYILKRFLASWVFVAALIIAVVVVIDITEKNDKFIQNDLTISEILPYYTAFIPFIANLITPITVFIAAVLLTSKLATRTEIVAILSSGVSFKRFMFPYFIGALIIALLSFWLNGWVIPNSNKRRVAFEIAYIKKPFNYSDRDIHLKTGPSTYMYLESYNTTSDVGHKFTLETIEGNKLTEKFEARRLEWIDSSESWRARDWTNRQFDGLDEVYTRGVIKDTTLRISPKDFASSYSRHETLNMNELNDYIDELTARGADDVHIYRIEKYIRYMSPFTVIILTFIALIVSARKSRGGTGFQIALGFFIAFVFIIFFVMSRAIAEAGSMHPILAVWMPNIIFTGLGLIMYNTVPR
ncbi:LptF/LptG family permease [Roseivirga sp. BDSF3-8]|uniref:LptF/LptG family permease n=1 Tax=Roseivirga sp. BDSF3-8 TaxID=3241598 RepID=UPI003531B2C0